MQPVVGAAGRAAGAQDRCAIDEARPAQDARGDVIGGETDSADYPEKGSIGESIVDGEGAEGDPLERQKNDQTAQGAGRGLLALVLPLVSRASDPARECQVGAFNAAPNNAASNSHNVASHEAVGAFLKAFDLSSNGNGLGTPEEEEGKAEEAKEEEFRMAGSNLQEDYDEEEEGVLGKVSSGVGAASEGGSTTDTPRSIDTLVPEIALSNLDYPGKGGSIEGGVVDGEDEEGVRAGAQGGGSTASGGTGGAGIGGEEGNGTEGGIGDGRVGGQEGKGNDDERKNGGGGHGGLEGTAEELEREEEEKTKERNEMQDAGGEKEEMGESGGKGQKGTKERAKDGGGEDGGGKAGGQGGQGEGGSRSGSTGRGRDIGGGGGSGLGGGIGGQRGSGGTSGGTGGGGGIGGGHGDGHGGDENEGGKERGGGKPAGGIGDGGEEEEEEEDKERAENDGDDKMINDVVSNAGIKFSESLHILILPLLSRILPLSYVHSCLLFFICSWVSCTAFCPAEMSYLFMWCL